MLVDTKSSEHLPIASASSNNSVIIEISNVGTVLVRRDGRRLVSQRYKCRVGAVQLYLWLCVMRLELVARTEEQNSMNKKGDCSDPLGSDRDSDQGRHSSSEAVAQAQ